MRPRLAVIGAIVGAFGPLQGYASADAPPVRAIAVIKATNECFSNVVQATGVVVPRTTAVVMFNAPGFRIAEISAQEGGFLKAGDQVAVAVAFATPSTSGGTPSGPGGVPQRIPIRSMVSGLVVKHNVEAGMPTSAASGPLLTLAVDGELEALVDVPGVHVLDIVSGQNVHLVQDDGREFGGHIRLAPLEIDKTTRFGQARVSVDSEQSPQVGRLVHVTIEAGRSCGIGVPLTALTDASDGTRLQVVRHGIVETLVVTLGSLNDTDAEIAAGVAEGDLVVADAGAFLHEGDKVNPVLTGHEDPR